MLKTKPTKRLHPKSLHINKTIESNNVKIVTEFNLIFNTIAAKIDERIISTSFAFRNTLREPNKNIMFLLPTTSGPNSISSKVLKNNKDVLSKPLCDIISLVFVSGTFP